MLIRPKTAKAKSKLSKLLQSFKVIVTKKVYHTI